MQNVKACIIVIGQEILAGVTLDTNSGYIAKKLRAIGVETDLIFTIPDEVSEIKSFLAQASEHADIIITTGGLGPTKDDKTKSAFAEFFQRDLVEDLAVLAHLKNYLESKNKGDLYQNNLEQGLIPQGSEPLLNSMGTAPGLCFNEKAKLYFMLPGVPYEMKHLLKEHVIPKVSSFFKLPFLSTRTLFVSGIPESRLSLMLEEWEMKLSDSYSLSYLPENSIVKLRLSLAGNNEETVKKSLEVEISKIKNILSGHYFDVEKESKEAIIQYHLKRLGYNLATAESFTGGLVLNRLLNEAGSSEVICGGICAYQTPMKNKVLGVPSEVLDNNPVVSAQIAEAMAVKAAENFGCDVGIGTTGCAGPATVEDGTPVGTAFYSIKIKEEHITKKLVFPGLERDDFVKFCINRIFQELILKLEKINP